MGVLVNLLGSGLSQGFERIHTTVLSEGEWDDFQSIGESSDGILFDSWDLKKLVN